MLLASSVSSSSNVVRVMTVKVIFFKVDKMRAIRLVTESGLEAS